MLQLWQTAMLRLTKLRVRDEIDNALSYFAPASFPEVPRLLGNTLKELAAHDRTVAELPPFFKVGMWIGGDRDGNPFVTRRHARLRDRHPVRAGTRTICVSCTRWGRARRRAGWWR